MQLRFMDTCKWNIKHPSVRPSNDVAQPEQVASQISQITSSHYGCNVDVLAAIVKVLVHLLEPIRGLGSCASLLQVLHTSTLPWSWGKYSPRDYITIEPLEKAYRKL